MTTPVSTVPVIDTPALAARLEAGPPFELWNVLTDEYFTGQMIPGSRRVPLDRIGQELKRHAPPKDALIVTHCSGPGCPQSRLATEKLLAFGYTNVLAYEGGLKEWVAAGLPLG